MIERPRLLIISAEHDICLKIAKIIGSEQYELEFSISVHTGLERLQGKMFDLVIADLQTPLVDTLDFKQSVRLLNHKQPLLFIARRTDTEHNAADLISRAFSPSNLINQISNTLETHRSPLEDLHIHTRPHPEAAEGFGLLTGTSQEMQDIYQNMRRAVELAGNPAYHSKRSDAGGSVVKNGIGHPRQKTVCAVKSAPV